MWLLTGLKEENKDQVFYIYQSKEHIVSRKGGEITLANDQSISRTHTRILYRNQKEDQISVTDLGSKYGTFLIDSSGSKQKLTENEEIYLKSGSVVQFGLQWNVFRLDYMPLVVCASTLSAGEKSQLKEIVETLNGEIVSDWQENVTYLTMNRITLTVKVVCALGYGKPIVNLNFWSSVMEAALNSRPFPNYEEFIPPLAEKALNRGKVSFKVDPDRQTLFAGKTFVVHSGAQKQRVENMVLAAGGRVVDWSDGILTKEQLRGPSFLTMKPNPSESQDVSDSYNQLMKYLKDNDIRSIGESEIGISVVYCSVDKYCNPHFDFNSNLMKAESGNSGSCLVPETQDSNRDSRPSDPMTIPESGPLTPANASRRSRLIDDEDAPNGFKTEAGDLSRDIFASDDHKSSLSTLASARKRPSAFVDDDDDDANVFNFSKRTGRINASSSHFEDENGTASRENGSESSGHFSKKPRLSMGDPDDVFSFPSKGSSAAKRRVSHFGDEIYTEAENDTKRVRLENDYRRPQITSWSQEIKNIDEKTKEGKFISKHQPVKIEKTDEVDGVESDEYLKLFRNKAVIESKPMMPAQRKEPVEPREVDKGPNFKKFKKNNVCRVNVMKIIGKNNLRTFQVSEHQDIWGNQVEEEQPIVDHFPNFETAIRRGR